MPGSRSDNKKANPLADFQQIEIDSIALGVVVARLVEKLNNRNFKFTLGNGIMLHATEAGTLIRMGVRTLPGERKVEYLSRAKDEMDGMLYPVDVALAASVITAEEKSAFDICFNRVSAQLHGLLNSQIAYLKKKANSAGRSSAGDAAGEYPK